MGKTALANGESQWITSEAARADVQHWRAQSGAVLTSAATVIADDPRLDVRIETPRQPMRVVLDRRRALRKTARILAAPGDVLVFAAPTTASARQAPSDERLGNARVERIRVSRSHLDLSAVFARLAELEVNDVLVEAGSAARGRVVRRRPGRRMAAVHRAETTGQGCETFGRSARDSRGSTPRPNSSCSIRRWWAATCGCGCKPERKVNVHRHRAGSRRSSGAAKRAPVRRGAEDRRIEVGFARHRRASGSSWATASASTACASRWRHSARPAFTPTFRVRRCASRRSAPSAPARA